MDTNNLMDSLNATSFQSSILPPTSTSSVYIKPLVISPAPDIDWGPQRDPLYIVIPITILYVIIFITGVVGNISTCIVISRNKSMHTATNYYLFSLAISDLLLLISGLPPDMYAIWFKYPYIFGEVFCVLQGFAAETSANATVLTITAFTVERYVAICHPFLSHTMSKLSRAVKYIVAVWIIAMILAIPQAMSFEIVHGNRDEQCVCTVQQTAIPHAFGISTLLFFVTPMSLITVLYILIGLQLHKSTVGPSRGNSVRLKHRVVSYTPTSTQPVIVLNGNVPVSQEEDGRKNFARNAQGTKHVVKMLVLVTVAFHLLWAPFHAQRRYACVSVTRTTRSKTSFAQADEITTSGILYFLSTSINPFLYHIMSHKFREAFKDTFKGAACAGHAAPKGSNLLLFTLSGRSSLINSHSNTDSCSRQSSYVISEAEMARLHDSKRPLVVSFKRHKKSAFSKSQTSHHPHDAELQEALDSLNESRCAFDFFSGASVYLRTTDQNFLRTNGRNHNHNHNHEKETRANSLGSIGNDYEAVDFDLSEGTTELSYVEVHNLEPTHICPVSGSRCGVVGCCYLKKFSETSMKEKYRRAKLEKLKRSRGCKVTWNNELTKSSTMPQIVKEMEAGEALSKKWKQCKPRCR
ncbi:pyrokinin-1 receptor-like [Atheta coriaria]|uniref:pyrokinin-1 receptor-like n=1 Tax=Dalotia coriaria TaxID=877792 RepID=UPI0031F3E312